MPVTRAEANLSLLLYGPSLAFDHQPTPAHKKARLSELFYD